MIDLEKLKKAYSILDQHNSYAKGYAWAFDVALDAVKELIEQREQADSIMRKIYGQEGGQ